MTEEERIRSSAYVFQAWLKGHPGVTEPEAFRRIQGSHAWMAKVIAYLAENGKLPEGFRG